MEYFLLLVPAATGSPLDGGLEAPPPRCVSCLCLGSSIAPHVGRQLWLATRSTCCCLGPQAADRGHAALALALLGLALPEPPLAPGPASLRLGDC